MPETKSPEVRAMLGELVRIQREKYGSSGSKPNTAFTSSRKSCSSKSPAMRSDAQSM